MEFWLVWLNDIWDRPDLVTGNYRFWTITTSEDQETSTTTKIERYKAGDDDPRGEEKLLQNKNTEDGVVFKGERMWYPSCVP